MSHFESGLARFSQIQRIAALWRADLEAPQEPEEKNSQTVQAEDLAQRWPQSAHCGPAFELQNNCQRSLLSPVELERERLVEGERANSSPPLALTFGPHPFKPFRLRGWNTDTKQLCGQ